MPRTKVQIPVPDAGCWTAWDVRAQQWSRVLNADAEPRCLCDLTRVAVARELLLHRVREIVHDYEAPNAACEVGGMPILVLRIRLRAAFMREAGLEPPGRASRLSHPYMVKADDTIAWALNQPDSGITVRPAQPPTPGRVVTHPGPHRAERNSRCDASRETPPGVSAFGPVAPRSVGRVDPIPQTRGCARSGASACGKLRKMHFRFASKEKTRPQRYQIFATMEVAADSRSGVQGRIPNV